MGQYGYWEDSLTDIEQEIAEEAAANVAKGFLPAIAEAEACSDVATKHKETLGEMLRGIERRIATIQSEPDDRQGRTADVERHEELQARVKDHLTFAD